MTQFNLTNDHSPEFNYQNGLLPQRNNQNLWYSPKPESFSCRSKLVNFHLSSENRRILHKTSIFTFKKILLENFKYGSLVQKQCLRWIKLLGWNFPVSSIKTVFTKHLFNTVYTYSLNQDIVAYAICYFTSTISHISYVFYDPKYSHQNLPIRLVLQTIIDSHDLGLEACYLGTFSRTNGFYKRTMPGFEYFKDNQWQNFH